MLLHEFFRLPCISAVVSGFTGGAVGGGGVPGQVPVLMTLLLKVALYVAAGLFLQVLFKTVVQWERHSV